MSGIVDHYSILGISPDSTQDQVKLAWRELARFHHPDRGGDPSRFTQIKDSYDVISDPSKRKVYDAALLFATSLRCSCGKAKMPGSDLCTWCGIRRNQDSNKVIDQEKSAQRKASFKDIASKIFGSGKIENKKKSSKNKSPTVGWPTGDEIFETMMAEAAVRSGLLDAGLDMDFRVQFDPLTGQVQLSGKTVEAMEKVRENLEAVNRIVDGVKRYSSSG